LILTKGFLLNVLNGYATRAYERVTAMAIASKFGARMISAITSVAALAMLSGCQGDPTVWKKDVLAPGGAWVATARTWQWGGFGSAWVETTVSLRKLNGTVNRGKPFDILSYPSGRVSKAYVLSDENADTDLQLTWSAPTRLQIYHRSDVNPDLVVVRFADIDINFRQSSSQP
jgi:hypothetical protein